MCDPGALKTFNDLIRLAKRKNYWADMVVRGIMGLSCGRLHQDNIFVASRKSLAYGQGSFYIVLPGVTASLEALANGNYLLTHIRADMNYVQMQQDQQKPGLWRVDQDITVPPTLQEDGVILLKEQRSVAIADMATDPVRLIAQEVRKDLVKTNDTIRSMAGASGFDLHHTPGGSGIVPFEKPARGGLTASEIRGRILHMDVTPGRAAWVAGFGVASAGAALSMGGASLSIAGAVGIAGGLIHVYQTGQAARDMFKGRQYQ